MASIYKIVNTINNKMYIGQTIRKDVRRRWSRHKSDLRLERHANKHLQSSWKKYGENAFEFVEIVTGLKDRYECNIWESIFIQLYGTYKRELGYNKRNDPCKKGEPNKEYRERMSKLKKAYYQTPKGKAQAKRHKEVMTGIQTSPGWEQVEQVREYWRDTRNGRGGRAHPGKTKLMSEFNITRGVAQAMIKQFQSEHLTPIKLDNNEVYNYWNLNKCGRRVLSRKFNISENYAEELIASWQLIL